MRTRLLIASVLILLLSLSTVAQCALSSFVVNRIKDAVVYVDVTLTLANGDEGGASGSGFVISNDGKIVTNAHVVSMEMETEDGGTQVAAKRQVQVIFHSGTSRAEAYDATVLRENPEKDLALLQIDLKTPVFLEMADSDAIQETTAVFVCGHPLGLKEISIRSGSVTAHRTWQGRPYIEHDAMAESGNSGGPVVDQDGRIIGVHTLTLATANNMTKFAIPSNVLRDWLASPASDDPKPKAPGTDLKALLNDAKLKFDEEDGGIFALPYDNDITVRAHQWKDFLRVYVKLGELPGDDEEEQGQTAIQALYFNYDDPVGRMSVWDDDGTLWLYWECQIPMSVASADYLREMADVAAVQAKNWGLYLEEKDTEDLDFAFPEGTQEELLPKLKQMLQRSGLKFEEKDKYFLVPYDNEVKVRCKIYQGMAYTYCYTGGMPGEDDKEQGQIAIELLKRNWDDPFGRLSLDEDRDLCWESQVPFSFLTPDYLSLIAGTCATQVASFWEEYGHVEFNGD